jgi:plasmid stabilization system protein ParE
MPAKKLRWSKSAEKQYLAAIEYILTDSVQNAEKAQKKFRDKLNVVSEFPETCPVDKYKVSNNGNYRVLIVYRYRVSYVIKSDEILILRVRHSSMKPKYY